MKITKIKVTNFKAISDQEIDFNGASAIITGGNNKGKTSFLRGLVDRLSGEIPSVIVKEGEDRGNYEMELSDGSKIEWRFTNKSESFIYTTKEGFRQTTGVIKAIGEKYFGKRFDIDEFLNSTPQKQRKTLEGLVGLDFTKVDAEYQNAFEKRTDANRELKRIIAINKVKPTLVEKPDIDTLKAQLTKLTNANAVIRNKWSTENTKHMQDIVAFNKEQEKLINEKDDAEALYTQLTKFESSIFAPCVDIEKAISIIDKLPLAKDKKPINSLPEPTYGNTDDLNNQIEAAQIQLRAYDAYDRELQQYESWVTEGTKAREVQKTAEKLVKEIEDRRNKMISGAKLPKEFRFSTDGIEYNGFPLTNSQVSSSGKYIAALKLGAMILGDVQTMYFDISLLDRESLNDIQEWAETQGLQLLLERPDFEAGDIKYEIISE